ncbi:hypothetical protein [Mycolicibacterium sp. P1-5]|uniref:hypothetical protein n=1 Tax=Mycolicibacterium sp. P1-5 TaxID=2024617 RepID=UPI0018832FE6|nr:hypothetical protein [Mycolicibacterium sp. P1-5]
MLSRVIPLEYLKERDLMFWLPPGGRDNDVWADTWVILADLEPHDAEPALAALRDADVGAYIAAPSGLKGATSRSVALYVDREQHNRATDVVMQFLRGKEQPVMPRAERIAPKIRRKIKMPTAPRPVVIAIQVALIAVIFAVGLLLAYYRGPQLFPGVHPAHPPADGSDVSVMKGSAP